MFEFISLCILKLLFPEQKTEAARKDDMNTAAAFFYGTSFENMKNEPGRQPDEVSQEQASPGDYCEYDDWLEW